MNERRPAWVTMLRSASWCLITVFVLCIIATPEIPFHSAHAEWQQATLKDEHLGDWSLDTAPNSNSTDHLVFETVHSLLQRWPNTRMRNGHAIVPGIIPRSTLLYHATPHNVLPTSHEWFATDPEHSYAFCEAVPEQDCWQFTLATTRPLKVVYFDGSSGVKLPFGTLDTQDILLWGETRGGRYKEDLQRIHELCKWGRRYGVDGFVRMQMDFEVMLCDLTSGVRVVSSLNLVSRWPQRTTIYLITAFELINAASRHNHVPGETRVQLDLAGLVTFYDTQIAPSLVAVRAGQQRWDHRVQNVSSKDLFAVKARLEEVLAEQEGLSSGIDWAAVIQVITDRYAQRLELTRYLLNTPTINSDEVLDFANKTQVQLRIVLTPYLPLSVTPTNSSDDANLDWATSVFKLCATTHTYFMDSESFLMTASEELLLQAVRGTTREICRVVTRMWAMGVHTGLDPLLNTKEHPDVAGVTSLRNAWDEELKHLMTWLDWSEWVKCDPVCGPEEMCHLPTWPFGFPLRVPSGKTDQSGSDNPGPKIRATTKEKLLKGIFDAFPPVTDEWIKPQPKCIRRLSPYGF